MQQRFTFSRASVSLLIVAALILIARLVIPTPEALLQSGDEISHALGSDYDGMSINDSVLRRPAGRPLLLAPNASASAAQWHNILQTRSGHRPASLLPLPSGLVDVPNVPVSVCSHAIATCATWWSAERADSALDVFCRAQLPVFCPTKMGRGEGTAWGQAAICKCFRAPDLCLKSTEPGFGPC